MRTFNRSDWDAALQAWTDGQFSDEWKPFRHQAAMRGMIYPPEGTRFDSWEDAEPSQRAMLIRAIRDAPSLLQAAIARSKSWGEVIAYVLARRDEWRAELGERERHYVPEGPSQRGAMLSLADILNRIGDS